MKKIALLLLATSLLMTSCTENERAKSYGGTMTLDIPKGQKVVNVTWKEEQIWYLTRTMSAKDTAESYTFHEKSTYGINEGTVILVEHK